MKKYLVRNLSLMAFVSFASVNSFGQANSGVSSDIDAELDQIYTANTQDQTPTRNSPQSTGGSGGIQNNGGQPIYILNQSNPSQNSRVQKQPTTFIEATPLNESRADQMRKARQDAELNTETRIVEKLEQSRLDDEKRRAQVLFGDKFQDLSGEQKNKEQVQAVPTAPVPVQVIQAPPPPVTNQNETRDLIRDELKSALQVEKEVPPQPVSIRYFGGMVGITEYPDAANVEGNYALGFVFGNKFDDTYSIDGSFVYSNYTVTDARNFCGNNFYCNVGPNRISQDVQQYSGALALKYFLFSGGLVRPVLGGLIQYSYRQYTLADKSRSTLTNPDFYSANSNAVDIGPIIGADIEFSPKTSLGLEFRYLINMTNRLNGEYQRPETPLEKMNHYVLTLSGRVSF